MTVDTTAGGSVAPYDPSWGDDLGLEDIGTSDVVIPRLQIQHLDGRLKDNLSGAEFDKLKVVLLGLVKQRIFWPDGDDFENVKPVCKSNNFEQGFPNVDPSAPEEQRFPWAKSNFNPADFPAESGVNGHSTLPCSSCIFKEWEKGDWKQPPCSELYTFPLLYTPDDGDTWTPALFTVQRSGIKPTRPYLSSFKQTQTPTFTVYTELSLTLNSKGTVRYSTPNYKRLEGTDRERWPEYANQYRSIRSLLHTPPRPLAEEDEGSTPVAAAPTAPPVAAAKVTVPTPAAPATAAPAPAAVADDDEDLPF